MNEKWLFELAEESKFEARLSEPERRFETPNG